MAIFLRGNFLLFKVDKIQSDIPENADLNKKSAVPANTSDPIETAAAEHEENNPQLLVNLMWQLREIVPQGILAPSSFDFLSEEHDDQLSIIEETISYIKHLRSMLNLPNSDEFCCNCHCKEFCVGRCTAAMDARSR